MPDAPYITIVNELDIIHSILRNPERNFHFNELVPLRTQDTPGGDAAANDHNVTQLPPFTEEQYPHIFMTTTDINPVAWGEARHRGHLTDVYTATVQFEISMRRAQALEYAGITYQKSVTALRAIYDVLSATFAHNAPFKADITLGARTGFVTISDVRAIGVGLRAGQADSPDAIDTLVATFQFAIEKSYTYHPGITLP